MSACIQLYNRLLKGTIGDVTVASAESMCACQHVRERERVCVCVCVCVCLRASNPATGYSRVPLLTSLLPVQHACVYASTCECVQMYVVCA